MSVLAPASYNRIGARPRAVAKVATIELIDCEPLEDPQTLALPAKRSNQILRMLVPGGRRGIGSRDRVRRVLAIVFLVVREVFARANVRNPLAIVLVPFDSLADAIV